MELVYLIVIACGFATVFALKCKGTVHNSRHRKQMAAWKEQHRNDDAAQQ